MLSVNSVFAAARNRAHRLLRSRRVVGAGTKIFPSTNLKRSHYSYRARNVEGRASPRISMCYSERHEYAVYRS